MSTCEKHKSGTPCSNCNVCLDCVHARHTLVTEVLNWFGRKEEMLNFAGYDGLCREEKALLELAKTLAGRTP